MIKNKIEINGEVTEIFIKRKDGKELITLIDTEDLHMLPNTSLYSWKEKNVKKEKYYVYYTCGNTTKRLHRLIANSSHGKVVDHINGNTLDNRKENLRIISQKDNMKNMELFTNNKSGITGVSYKKANKKWVAQITVNGKKKHLGYFKDKDEAAKTYLEAKKIHHRIEEGEASGKPRS